MPPREKNCCKQGSVRAGLHRQDLHGMDLYEIKVIEFLEHGGASAQLLEFRCLGAQAAAPPEEDEAAIEILPATGLPEAAAFESWHFGPRLVVAGERLLLMTDPAHRGAAGQPAKVQKVSVHALQEMPDGTMRWGGGGQPRRVQRVRGLRREDRRRGRLRRHVAGNCIYFAEMTFYRGDCQRYWRSLSPWWKWEHFTAGENKEVTISRGRTSQTWARLFFQS